MRIAERRWVECLESQLHQAFGDPLRVPGGDASPVDRREHVTAVRRATPDEDGLDTSQVEQVMGVTRVGIGMRSVCPTRIEVETQRPAPLIAEEVHRVRVLMQIV